MRIGTPGLSFVIPAKAGIQRSGRSATLKPIYPITYQDLCNMFWDLLWRLRVAERGEYSVAFLAGNNRAPRAYHAGRVQIFRMIFDVE
jgi:hypothetical protein